MNVKKGNLGGFSLDGLSFAYMASWPKALHFGGGTAKLFIDEKASTKLRDLMERMLKGKLGGKPWPIFAPTIDKWLETSFVPIEWKSNASESEVVVGEQVRVALQPMRNPVTGKEVRAKILLPDGLLTREENVTATKVFSVFADGLKYAWPGKTAFYATVEHGGN